MTIPNNALDKLDSLLRTIGFLAIVCIYFLICIVPVILYPKYSVKIVKRFKEIESFILYKSKRR